MSAELLLHGRRIESVFELLGRRENDITYSIGWALAQSAAFRTAVLQYVFKPAGDVAATHVALQQYAGQLGITDIEMRGPAVHVIVEAKRGWTVPSQGQLERYAKRLRSADGRRVALVTMSECSREYATLHLPAKIGTAPVVHLAWRDVSDLARTKRGTHAEKRLLAQLRTFLERVVEMQDQTSNLVYVVALANGTPEWSRLSSIEIVTKRSRYFHPFGGSGWPTVPPNYLGFRYGGRLQRIHHVEDWKVVTEMSREIPDISSVAWAPHLLYTLGPPIVPGKVVKTGKIFPAGRVWAMLDLLLTCDTISEAHDLTKKRQAGERADPAGA